MPRRQAHREIGAAAESFDGIEGGRIAHVEIRSEIHREIRPGRISGDADAGGIDPPFGGAMTHEANGALCIEQGQRLDAGIVDEVGRTEPILQSNDGDPERIEDGGGVIDVDLPVEPAVATARTDDQGDPVALRRVGGIDGDRGHGDAAKDAALVACFRLGSGEELRRFPRPKRDHPGGVAPR